MPGGISQTQTGKCKGKVVSVESPVELHVYDNAGNHTGLTALPGMPDAGLIIEEGIPGSTYEELLESKFVYLSEEGTYTIRLNATGEGTFNLRLRSYQDDQVVRTIVYLRVPLTPTTVGQLEYATTASTPPFLQLDHDGNGTFEQTFTATSDLGADESADSQAPNIQILSPGNHQAVIGATVAWRTNDNLSGVLAEEGIIDNNTPAALRVANGSTVALPTGEHTLTVLAEDRFGNASHAEVSFIVYAFEWRPPLITANPYIAQTGRTIPVKFKVLDLIGGTVHDETVELRLLDSMGNTVGGPFFFANNPAQGVAIQGDGQYHHNLRTAGLAPGTYTLQVTFNSPQLSGLVTRTILIEP